MNSREELGSFLNSDCIKSISEEIPALAHLFKEVGNKMLERLDDIDNPDPNLPKNPSSEDLMAYYNEKYKDHKWEPGVQLKVISNKNNPFYQFRTFLKNEPDVGYPIGGITLFFKSASTQEEADRLRSLALEVEKSLVGYSITFSKLDILGI